MYRSAAKRLLRIPAVYRTAAGSQFTRTTPSITPTLTQFTNSPYFCTTATTDSSPNQNPNNPLGGSTTSFGTAEGEKARGGESRSSRGPRHRAHYEDEQARVLNASLGHVVRTFFPPLYILFYCLLIWICDDSFWLYINIMFDKWEWFS